MISTEWLHIEPRRQIHDGGFAAVHYRGRWEFYAIDDGLELFVRYADDGEANLLERIWERHE